MNAFCVVIKRWNSQDRAKVETILRQPDGSWSMRIFEGKEEVAPLRSLQIDLPLSEVYDKVDLPAVAE